MFPIITPIYIPMHEHDPEEDKVECPKCKHRFFLPEDSCSSYCALPFILFGVLFFSTCVIGALSILGLVDPDQWFKATGKDSFEIFFGGNILAFLLAIPTCAVIHFFERRS